MGKPTGFLEFSRQLPQRRAVADRLRDFKEVEGAVRADLSVEQANRCMNCGTPFCHNGCPLGNNIPEFNQAVSDGNWREAFGVLQSTNNFPEFTGRVCPAPCEASCVLGINQPPVTIEYLEKAIIEKAFEEGWVEPRVPKFRTGKRVAIIGSGPAGLAAAAQMNTAGHHVTVFERSEAAGGLLRFGIPDFKLEKTVIDRRIAILEKEGVEFRLGMDVSGPYEVSLIRASSDVVILGIGAAAPRDLSVPGRTLKGIHLAMDFLSRQNRALRGNAKVDPAYSAEGRHVVILGGGDTGADCLGTALRHGAKSVLQVEILPKPPQERSERMPWPTWPVILRSSTSHEEGGNRDWALLTKEFIGNAQGFVCGLKVVSIQWKEAGTGFVERPDTERVIPCDMILLALGFTGPQRNGIIESLGLALDERGIIRTDHYQTSVPGVFAAGDARRGQSLVVWALHEGREAARAADAFLMGSSILEGREVGTLRVQ